MFRSSIFPCAVVACVMFGNHFAEAADSIDNPMANFDITCTNQNYGAAFTANSSGYYTIKFEYEAYPAIWSELGSNTKMVMAGGAENINVQLGTLNKGTQFTGRVRLFKNNMEITGAQKNGTFRGPP